MMYHRTTVGYKRLELFRRYCPEKFRHRDTWTHTHTDRWGDSSVITTDYYSCHTCKCCAAPLLFKWNKKKKKEWKVKSLRKICTNVAAVPEVGCYNTTWQESWGFLLQVRRLVENVHGHRCAISKTITYDVLTSFKLFQLFQVPGDACPCHQRNSVTLTQQHNIKIN